MFKKNIACMLLALLLFVGLIPAKSMAATVQPVQKVLLLYQERNFFGDQRDSVAVIEELLGHFQASVTEASISSFDLSQLSHYQLVFVIALDQVIENPPLYEALAQYEGEILWLGNSVAPLILAGQYPLLYEGENLNFVTLEFQTAQMTEPLNFSIGEKRPFYQVRSLSEDNAVFAWLSDGYHRSPYLIQSKNLSYVSRVDMNEPLFYIFAAYLHKLLPSKETPQRQLLVSMQDVHGFSDQKNLRALADVFHDNAIPFAVQLIPYFQMSGSKQLTRFDNVPGFVETLKYLEEKGGCLILEAFPAELDNDEVRALPLSTLYKDEANPLSSYMASNVILLLEKGLHPVGISSPHSALTHAEYTEIKSHFSNFIGHRYITEGQLVIYPYVLEQTKHFNRFYPLNLGYIDPKQVASSATFEEQLTKIMLVPNHFTGVYITPDLPPDKITPLMTKVEQYNLKYFDLKTEPFWVRFNSVTYTQQEVMAGTVLIEQPPKTFLTIAMETLSGSVLTLLVMGIVLFLFLLVRSTRLTRNIHRRR